jgi:predicted  nucleic acid-binding Zn-ribbon protein
MARLTQALILLLASASMVDATATATAANPIRKVVTMLQNMQTKVTEEGKKEQDLFEKFMCYCKTSGGDLDASIQAAKDKIEATASAIEAATKKKAQTEADLKEHQTSLADAETAMAEATAIREKEAAAYAQEKSDLETNLAALSKAIAAIEKGAAGAFLQTTAASAIKQYAMEKATLPDATREELLSFLSGSQSEGYAPQSGEITGILKTMEDEMSKSLEDANNDEAAAIKNYEELMAAKKKEVETLQAQIESEMTRVGNLGVEIAGMANDLEDTKEALAEDEKFQLELASSCKTKEAEWEEICKTRSEELVALAETIKILNDDDALELFKKTIPSASSSFMQVTVTSKAVRSRALEVIRKANNPALKFIELALNGKKIGFEKVIKMIDEMAVTLKKEQGDDDSKKEYCETQFDQTEDKIKELDNSVSDSETAIKEMTGAIATLKEEIAALEAGVVALDKSVAEATEQRKEENADYKELMQNDGAAKEILKFAKNRLNKFYNPKLYVAPPAGAPAFVQIRAHSQKGFAAPPPPPETFGAYTKKSEDSNGVIGMIDLLVKDLDKEMQEAELNEKHAQGDYETTMEDASTKRAADTKLSTEKEGLKASTEGELEAEKDKKTVTVKDLMATGEYLASLHKECDWLLQTYDARKAARSSEIEALGSAKAVLNGADFSLIQSASRTRTGFMAKRF